MIPLAVTLSRTEKVSFQFAGISFKSLGQVTYKFRLKEYDTVWALSKEGNRELELLPPGDYKLEVKAVDRFGNESRSMIIPVEVLTALVPVVVGEGA
ncbi:MAG: hypothetical protein HC867_03345, partial [Bacteroidia bacterium]|nr:hypothetical protein [Bacteroidia bacterium]